MLFALLREEVIRSTYPRNGAAAYKHCIYGAAHCGCEHHWQSCRLNFALDWFSEYHNMPRNNKSNQPAFTPTTFVRCELTSEEKKDVPEFIRKNSSSLDDLVVEVLQTNHKISFSFNGQTDSFICSVTGKAEDCNNASKCYTSHAKDYATALWVALYKFHVIWKRGVWEEVESTGDFG